MTLSYIQDNLNGAYPISWKALRAELGLQEKEKTLPVDCSFNLCHRFPAFPSWWSALWILYLPSQPPQLHKPIFAIKPLIYVPTGFVYLVESWLIQHRGSSFSLITAYCSRVWMYSYVLTVSGFIPLWKIHNSLYWCFSSK